MGVLRTRRTDSVPLLFDPVAKVAGKVTHMTEHIVSGSISLVGGWLVAQAVPVAENTAAIEKIGLAGILAMVIYWMLFNFSKRLDKLTDAIERLAGGEPPKRGK